MWTKMIQVAGRLAARFDIPHSDIKARLPINPEYGTIHYAVKLVAYYKWEDQEGKILEENTDQVI